jgi:Calcium-activated chloride channel
MRRGNDGLDRSLNKSTNSLTPATRTRGGLVHAVKQNSTRSLDSEPIAVTSSSSATTTTKAAASPCTNTTTNNPEESPRVKAHSLGAPFRLSRNLSRVLHTSRSPSPSRRLLAAEIMSQGATKLLKPCPPAPCPPLEQTPLLLLRFTPKVTPKLIQLVQHALTKSGLIVHDQHQVVVVNNNNDTQTESLEYHTYMYLTAAQEALEAVAEQCRWMKRTNDTQVVECFTVARRKTFISSKKKRKPNEANSDKKSNNNDDIWVGGGDELFTSNEWCYLAFRLLDTVEIMTDGTKSSSALDLMLLLQQDPTSSSPASRMEMMRASSNMPSSFTRQGSSSKDLGNNSSHHSSSSQNFNKPSIPRQGSSSRDLGNKNNNNNLPNRRAFRRQASNDDLSPPSSGHGVPYNRRQNFHNKNFHRQQSVMLQRVKEHGKRSTCLRHVLQAHDFVDVVTPLHWGPARDAIVMATWKPRQLTPPVQDIRNYYGEDVAFYFAWMGFLSRWLVVLGGMGCATVLFRWIRGDNVDEDEFTPMYGIFTFCWGVLFLRFWERHEHRLAYQWGTYSLSYYDKQQGLTKRPEFKGVLRVSPVTGDYETYYPAHSRRLQYVVSVLVTMVMLAVAFCMMILSLNMQGYIHPERNPERWHPNNPHPFHYHYFAVLSERGAIFDSKHFYRSFIPTFIHVAVIFTLNNLYRIIATMLTEWENHETDSAYQTSLIVKRFLFEAFDCYAALFYLAFYERDVYRLQMELATVFNIDTFRRLTMECFIPIMMQKISKWSQPRHPHNNHDGNAKKVRADEDDKTAKVEANTEDESTGPDTSTNTTVGSPRSAGTASTASLSDTETEAVMDEPYGQPGNGCGKTNAKVLEDDSNGSHFSSNSRRGAVQSTLEALAEDADKDEYVSTLKIGNGIRKYLPLFEHF